MKNAFTFSFSLWASLSALPLQAAPPSSIWNSGSRPIKPYQYIEPIPESQLELHYENGEIYAPDALFTRLYPSIEQGATPVEPPAEVSIASKTTPVGPKAPRGILSSSYLQEFAYINTYSNIGRYEQPFTLPSIRLRLAMPGFGYGFGGGYQPLQFGFGPAAFSFW